MSFLFLDVMVHPTLVWPFDISLSISLPVCCIQISGFFSLHSAMMKLLIQSNCSPSPCVFQAGGYLFYDHSIYLSILSPQQSPPVYRKLCHDRIGQIKNHCPTATPLFKNSLVSPFSSTCILMVLNTQFYLGLGPFFFVLATSFLILPGPYSSEFTFSKENQFLLLFIIIIIIIIIVGLRMNSYDLVSCRQLEDPSK